MSNTVQDCRSIVGLYATLNKNDLRCLLKVTVVVMSWMSAGQAKPRPLASGDIT